jgi:nucleoside-diphosphate-sugar epimerase
MKVILTGSSSFIGRRLLAKLESCGHVVISIGRNETVRWKLGEDIPTFEDASVLIHLAYDRSRNLSDSIHDSELIINSFSGKIIYLSSMSAHSKAKSSYGRRKYAEECLFMSAGASVLKAGLVIGPDAEGVFGKLRLLVERLPIIPVLMRGRPLFYISQIENLLNEINHVLISSKSGIIRASSKAPLSLKEIIKQIASGLGDSKRLILLPKYPIHFVFVLLRIFSSRPHLIDSYFSITEEISAQEVENLLPPSTEFADFNLK